MDTPKNFNELVTWATWEVIEGLTKGEPLRQVMYKALWASLQISAEWKNKTDAA